MPRPDNENQYKYGAYDQRTADEDRRLYQQDADRRHQENVRMLEDAERQRQQDEQNRRNKEAEAERKRRQNEAKRQQQQQEKNQSKTSKQVQKNKNTPQKSNSQSANTDEGFDGFIALAGAAGAGVLAYNKIAPEFWPVAISAIAGGGIAYALRDLVKVAIGLAVIGGVVYFVLTQVIS